MGYGYGRTDDPARLRRENEQLRYEMEEQARRAEQEREDRRREEEQRRRELQERIAERERSASTWPEAFQKQQRLMWREYRAYPDLMEGETSHYFKEGAEACLRAGVLWTEIEAESQAKIEELERQIAALRADILQQVSERLKTERQTDGWLSVANEILSENYADDPGAWLDW